MLTFKSLEGTEETEGGLLVTWGDINCGVFLEGTVDGMSSVIHKKLKQHNVEYSLEEVKTDFRKYLKENQV